MSDFLPFDEPDDAPAFDGPAYDAPVDRERLGKQALAIFDLMKDGHWRTLHQIAVTSAYPEASVSAQLRHFRKARFGAHTLNRRRQTEAGGTWEYQLITNPQGEFLRYP